MFHDLAHSLSRLAAGLLHCPRYAEALCRLARWGYLSRQRDCADGIVPRVRQQPASAGSKSRLDKKSWTPLHPCTSFQPARHDQHTGTTWYEYDGYHGTICGTRNMGAFRVPRMCCKKGPRNEVAICVVGRTGSRPEPPRTAG